MTAIGGEDTLRSSFVNRTQELEVVLVLRKRIKVYFHNMKRTSRLVCIREMQAI